MSHARNHARLPPSHLHARRLPNTGARRATPRTGNSNGGPITAPRPYGLHMRSRVVSRTARSRWCMVVRSPKNCAECLAVQVE